MSIDEVLRHSDREILHSSLLAVAMVKEWHKITGEQPSACDCQLKNYLRTVRNFYKGKMETNKFYFDGVYFDSQTITEAQKEQIHLRNPSKYADFASKFGWKTDKITTLAEDLAQIYDEIEQEDLLLTPKAGKNKGKTYKKRAK